MRYALVNGLKEATKATTALPWRNNLSQLRAARSARPKEVVKSSTTSGPGFRSQASEATHPRAMSSCVIEVPHQRCSPVLHGGRVARRSWPLCRVFAADSRTRPVSAGRHRTGTRLALTMYALARACFGWWWQVLGSNQRRLSRRSYRTPPATLGNGPDLQGRAFRAVRAAA